MALVCASLHGIRALISVFFSYPFFHSKSSFFLFCYLAFFFRFSMAGSSTSSQAIDSLNPIHPINIPPQLKFVLSNIKNLVSTSLIFDNYPLWRSQVEKIFIANGFKGFLDGSYKSPPKTNTSDSSTMHGTFLIKMLLLPCCLSLFHLFYPMFFH